MRAWVALLLCGCVSVGPWTPPERLCPDFDIGGTVITGYVISRDGPLAAAVTAFQGDAVHQAEVWESGCFITPAGPGPWSVTATADGHAAQTVQTRALADVEEFHVGFVLERDARP